VDDGRVSPGKEAARVTNYVKREATLSKTVPWSMTVTRQCLCVFNINITNDNFFNLILFFLLTTSALFMFDRTGEH
jgi:hypothetical protein